jgi:hypothetical protein
MVRTSPIVRAGVLLLALFAFSVSTASAAAPNLFARVAINGTLLAGNGVTSVFASGGGVYEVTFNVNVSACAFVATTANSYAGAAITVFTAGGHFGPNGVYIETKNQGGGVQPGAFNLVVVCSQGKMFKAVVGYSDDLVRSTPGATLTVLGVGRYQVNFLASVKACAFIATVGDPGNALVFAPAGVYTGSGSTNFSVYVETKNPAGGLSGGVPFHLAVICNTAKKAHVAVTDSSGVPIRGTALTSTFRVSTGQYVAASGALLGDCATVATRGSVNTAVPFTPATIETTPGPALNTTGLEVRQLGFFGGALLDEQFHVASVCK